MANISDKKMCHQSISLGIPVYSPTTVYRAVLTNLEHVSLL